MNLRFCRLGRPGDVLPMPDRDMRPFPADGMTVDTDLPFYLLCLADGSLIAAGEDDPAGDAGAAS